MLGKEASLKEETLAEGRSLSWPISDPDITVPTVGRSNNFALGANSKSSYLDKTLPRCGNCEELGQRLQETPQGRVA